MQLRWSVLALVVLLVSLTGSLGAAAEIRVGDTVVVQREAALRRGFDVVATVKQGRRLKVLTVKGQWVGTAVVSDGRLVGGWVLRREVELVREAIAEPLAALEPTQIVTQPRSPEPPRPLAESPQARWTNPLVDCVTRFKHWLAGSTPSPPPLPAVTPEPLEPKWSRAYEADLPPARAPRATAEPHVPPRPRVGNPALELPDFPLPTPWH